MIFSSFKYIFIFLICSFQLKAKDSVVVYFFLLDECRICQEMTPYINQIYDNYHQEFSFVGLFPNFSSTPEGIETFKSKYKVIMPLLSDHLKIFAHKLGATIMPEVVVYNHTKDKIVYKGKINDLYYAPGKRKHHIKDETLINVLTKITAGEKYNFQNTQAVGCFINYSELLQYTH